MKKPHLIFSLSLQTALAICCYAGISENGKVDSVQLKNCMDAVNKINSMPLTKTYLVWSLDGNWTLSVSNPKENASNRFLDECSIYKDAHENIRKIIYTNYEYSYDVVICYYDPFGQLIRAVFNIKDDAESFWGYQYADQGELIYSNIAYIKYDPDYVEPEGPTFENESHPPAIVNEYAYEGKLLNFASSFFQNFTNVNIFKDYFHIADFPSECTTVTFSLDVKSGKTIVGSNNVRIRDAAHLKSNVVETLYAGDDITIIEQSKRENIAPYGEFYWYKVSYQNFFVDDHTGYIFGAFLEPIETEIKP
jgi:hypothetical protein